MNSGSPFSTIFKDDKATRVKSRSSTVCENARIIDMKNAKCRVISHKKQASKSSVTEVKTRAPIQDLLPLDKASRVKKTSGKLFGSHVKTETFELIHSRKNFVSKGRCSENHSKKLIKSNLEKKSLIQNFTKSTLAAAYDESSVKRYALYRGMLRSSCSSNAAKKDSKAKLDVRATTKESLVPSLFHQEKQMACREEIRTRGHLTQSHVNVESESVPVENVTSCDLRGTEFPKRIFIRETVKGAIVDELVDVKNKRDWEILTYMSPLLPLRQDQKSSKNSRDVSFQDLEDFQIYYSAIPWKQ